MSGSLPEDQAGLYVLGALGDEEMRAVRAAAAGAVPMPRRVRGGVSRRPLVFWRAAAVGAMALAASLAVVLVTRGPPLPARVAMVLPDRPGEGGWLVEVSDRGELHVRANGPLSLAADRDYQLWALAEGATKPVPLGLMPVNASAVIKADRLPTKKYQLLVSLEPKGGSPTGLPTGPVMYAGEVVTWR
jgi:anti-sigma-K factor RskA